MNDNIILGDKINTKNEWSERKNIIFNNQKIYTNIQDVIDINKEDNGFSLCIFKPKEILDFIVEENVNYEKELEKLKNLKEKTKQIDLFEERKKNFSFMPRLDKKFSYKFIDSLNTTHCLQVEDWETGQLYINAKKDINKVKQKYLDEFKTKDLYFFLGTQKRYDGWSKNPFIIVGVFYPPFVEEKIDLFSF